MLKRLMFLLCMFAFFNTCYAANLIVPSTYSTIQEAIDAANDGDTIILNDGTYSGDGNIDLKTGNKQINIQSLTGKYENCIIDCNRKGRAFYIRDSSKVVNIKNITIKNGLADSGGAIFIYFCYQINIENCYIFNNSSSLNGAGIYSKQGGTLNINRCIVSNNVTGRTGCGEVSGGGIYSSYTNTYIINSIVSYNQVKTYGGGVYFGGNKNYEIINSDIIGNQATFTEVSEGGGLYFTDRCKIINSIIRNNTSTLPDLSTGIYPNGAQQIAPEYWVHYTTIANNNIQYVDTNYGSGNIDADPLFESSSNFKLQSGSPCIDSGTSDDAPSVDLLNQKRPCGSGFDMGAYEYCGSTPPPTPTVTFNINKCEAQAPHTQVFEAYFDESTAQGYSYGWTFSDWSGQVESGKTVTRTFDDDFSGSATFEIFGGIFKESIPISITDEPPSPTNNKHYIPYLINTGDVWTGIAVSNYGNSGSNTVSVKYYDEQGILKGEKSLGLPGNGQDAFVVSPDLVGGWAEMSSEKDVYPHIFQGDDYSVNSYGTLPEPMKQAVFPHVDTKENWSTMFFASNPGDDTTYGYLNYYLQNGTLMKSQGFNIPSKQAVNYDLKWVFGSGGVPAELYGGTLVVETDKGVCAYLAVTSLVNKNTSFVLPQ